MSIVEQLEAAGETLSPAVRRALVALEAKVRVLEEERARLEQEREGLKERVRALELGLSQNSMNSSTPPSADPPGFQRPKKRPTGRARGGQPRHRGVHRTLVPLERVDRIVEHRPERCRRCRADLSTAPEVGTRGRHQVVELPPIRAEVAEHQTVTLACERCGAHTRAPLPTAVHGRHFGPRLVAFSLMLVTHFRLSRRKLVALLQDLLDVEGPALGTTEAFVREGLAALHGPYGEVMRAVRRSAVANADETGWKLRGLPRTLWVAVCRKGALFRIARSRGARDRIRLLGKDHPGILVTDRWRAYDGHPPARRQVCWAHLKRNWQAVLDGGGPGAPLATEALDSIQELFRAWDEYRDGELSHAELCATLLPLKTSYHDLLTRATASEDKKARALGRDLLRLWPALWTFLVHEGVPPTNNAAEQALRGAVIWRKTSFGSQSGRGMRFVERVLTVTETCRMNQTNILDYLTRAIVAHRQKQPAPRLLPTG